MSEMVPEGWEESEICDFVNVGRGYAFKSSDYRSDGNPIVRVTNISEANGLDLSNDVVYLAKDRAKEFESYLLRDDDFLLVMVGATVGKYAKVATKGKPLFLNQNMWRLSVIDAQTNWQKFAIYGLQKVVEEFLRTMQGSAREFLTQKEFGKASIFVPPFPEQKKIASILTSVDEVIEKTQSQIDKLQDLKKGTMDELLTKGIGHTEFKDSELGRIPKSWEVASIAEISHFVTSGSRGWSQYYSERGAIFIRIGNLIRDNINLDFEDTVRVTPPVNGEGVRTKVSLGDILISITADLGVIGVVHDGVGEAYVNQHVSLVRLKENSPVIARWAGHYLSGEVCQHQFRIKNDGGAKAGLNLPTIRSIRLAQPSSIEQERICGILDGFDTQIHRNRIKLHQTQSLKKSLMQDLLTGKVRVSVN